MPERRQPTDFSTKKTSRPAKTQTATTMSGDSTGAPAGDLSRAERRVAEERTAPRAAVIHEAIRSEGESELRLTPVLIGNTIGGVSLVAFFNHAQVVFNRD